MMNSKCLVGIMAMFLIASIASWAAEDGAVLYNRKCAGCHGASDEGKPAMKAPALKGTTKDASQLVGVSPKANRQAKRLIARALPDSLTLKATQLQSS
jgi:mono/diheme cytochrome c family protein